MVAIILNQSFILVGLESQIKEAVGGDSFEGENKKWKQKAFVKQKLELSFFFPKKSDKFQSPSIQHTIPSPVSSTTH